MVVARLAAGLAAPSEPAEFRRDLVEWVDLIAVSPAMMARLERCQGGELVCVSGPVTLKRYEPEGGGKTRVDRTMFVEYIRAASASMGDLDKGKKSQAGPTELPSEEAEPAGEVTKEAEPSEPSESRNDDDAGDETGSGSGDGDEATAA